MSYFSAVRFSDSPSVDAFGRLRVSNPETLFDSKQLYDAEPLFWDDAEVSGGSTSTTHSTARASTVIGVAATTAGKRVRQTFQRFNYQPGKSQLTFLTFILDKAGGGTGITRGVGLFDDNNGLFLKDNAGTYQFVIRSSVTGSPVDSPTSQASWNLDPMDGTGPSGVTLDFSKVQILAIDYEWLGVGRVRFGFVIDGLIIYAHEVLHANSGSSVFMSTPNLPVRYSIENGGSGAASTLEHICATVITEGGLEPTGIVRSVSTAGTHVDANAADTLYAVLGVRLKSTHLAKTVTVRQVTVLSETNDNFEWSVWLNPTVASTFTYSDESNSAVQTAKGATANTVSGGYLLASGFSSSTSEAVALVSNVRHLGAKIDGTRDEIVLCVRPLSINADIQATMTWLEAR